MLITVYKENPNSNPKMQEKVPKYRKRTGGLRVAVC